MSKIFKTQVITSFVMVLLYLTLWLIAHKVIMLIALVVWSINLGLNITLFKRSVRKLLKKEEWPSYPRT